MYLENTRCTKQGVFNKFLNAYTSGRPLQICTPTRDFIYADDLVAGFPIEGTRASSKKGDIFHLSSRNRNKNFRFFKVLFKEYGSEHSFEFQSAISTRRRSRAKFSITCQSKRYIWFQVIITPPTSNKKIL